MKSYMEKEFNKEYLKKIDIQQLGTYYNVPIKDIFEEKRAEFDYEDLENDTILLDRYSIDSGEYVENYDNVEYDYTDEWEIEDILNNLMNYKKYNHYLVVLFNSRWTGASGYKITNDYISCFERDYDCTMKLVSGSAKGKFLELRESHHDCPTGHTSIIVGLTEKEYEKLDNMSIDKIIEFGESFVGKGIEV